MNLGELDKNKSGNYNNWKQAVLEKKKKKAHINPPDPNRLFI